MKSFKGYLNESILLNEAETQEATRTEQAICYQYNMRRSEENHEISLSKAGMTQKDFELLNEKLQDIGKNVAKHSKLGWGEYLNHSGKADKGVTNHYKGGAQPDKTPKTDIAGNKSHNISLKKAGGSQLASGKSAETAGILTSAIKHHDNIESIKLTDGIEEVVKDLQKKMESTSRNELQVEVAGAKRDFQSWYIQKNSENVAGYYSKLQGRKKSDAVEKHLKYELQYHGAAPVTTKKPKQIEEILGKGKIISKKEFEDMQNQYTQDIEWALGGTSGRENILVSKKHRMRGRAGAKVDITLNDDALKKQVIEVLDVSMKSKDWVIQLEKLFSDNESLKKWVAYEAASGLYKFTGRVSKGSSYESPNSPVANKIVVFNDGGIKGGYQPDGVTVLDWAKSDGYKLVDNVGLGYKGAGMSKAIVMRIFAEHYDSELSILQEEISNIQSEYLLNEGFFRDMKDKLKGLKDRIVKAIKAFYERFIAKFVNALIKLAKEGVDKFMEAVGIEMRVKIAKPKW